MIICTTQLNGLLDTQKQITECNVCHHAQYAHYTLQPTIGTILFMILTV